MPGTTAPRALEAFSRGLRAQPAYVSENASWGGMTVCEWDLSWLDGFELCENSDFVVAYHSAGSRRVRAACNGAWSRTRSTPGLISVIPPGRRIEYRIDGGVSFSTIHIPGKSIEYTLNSLSLDETGFRFAFEDHFASVCMDKLLQEAHDHCLNSQPLVNAVSRALLLHLTRNLWKSAPAVQVKKSDETLLLEAVGAYVDARLDRPLRLDDLARHAGLSRSHFTRRFHAAAGVPPHRFLLLRRIDRAKELLLHTGSELVEIAHEVGFQNQSHFTQVFRAVTGLTPGKFRHGSSETS